MNKSRRRRSRSAVRSARPSPPSRRTLKALAWAAWDHAAQSLSPPRIAHGCTGEGCSYCEDDYPGPEAHRESDLHRRRAMRLFRRAGYTSGPLPPRPPVGRLEMSRRRGVDGSVVQRFARVYDDARVTSMEVRQ